MLLDDVPFLSFIFLAAFTYIKAGQPHVTISFD